MDETFANNLCVAVKKAVDALRQLGSACAKFVESHSTAITVKEFPPLNVEFKEAESRTPYFGFRSQIVTATLPNGITKKMKIKNALKQNAKFQFNKYHVTKTKLRRAS